jgi:hypothetical protein
MANIPLPAKLSPANVDVARAVVMTATEAALPVGKIAVSGSENSYTALVALFNCSGVTKFGCRKGAATWAECSGGGVRSRGGVFGPAAAYGYFGGIVK